MQIETLTTENCQRAYQLCQRSHPVPWSSKTFKDCLSAPYKAYQLLDDNELVGYYITLHVVDEITLMDIAIDKCYQNLGKGRQLLQHCLTSAVEQQASVVWLEVRQSNTPAVQLYQSEGFELLEVRKGYYQTENANQREDALIMRWQPQ